MIEKIDIIEKSTTTNYDNGIDNPPTSNYLDLKRGLIHLNDQINKIIDVLNELDKQQ